MANVLEKIKILYLNLFGEKRYCPMCNSRMKIISIGVKSIISGNFVAYKCTGCGSILHSPINESDEDDDDGIIGTSEIDYGDIEDE